VRSRRPGTSTGTKVAVINAATCNAARTAGCGQTPAVVSVGTGTAVLAVSAATNTIYAPNSGSSFSGDTMSVINGATCDGTDTAGCTGPFPAMAAGRSPLLAQADTSTGIIYVTDFSSAAVSILDGSRCNASLTSGCGAPPREQPVGSQPFGLAINPDTSTVYVDDTFQAGSISILSTLSPGLKLQPIRSTILGSSGCWAHAALPFGK
jgi:DNA-binding beta-propeller fold protein YncE